MDAGPPGVPRHHLPRFNPCRACLLTGAGEGGNWQVIGVLKSSICMALGAEYP